MATEHIFSIKKRMGTEGVGEIWGRVHTIGWGGCGRQMAFTEKIGTSHPPQKNKTKKGKMNPSFSFLVRFFLVNLGKGKMNVP